jgi:hypothetical protein
MKNPRVLATIWVLVVASLACTNYHEVSSSSYSDLEPSPRHGYRIATRDDHVYVVERLSVRDSTILVEAPTGKGMSDAVAIPFDQIRSVEKIEKNYLSPIVLGAGVVALIVALATVIDDIPAMD